MLENCMLKRSIASSNVCGPYGAPILEINSKIERICSMDLTSVIGS